MPRFCIARSHLLLPGALGFAVSLPSRTRGGVAPRLYHYWPCPYPIARRANLERHRRTFLYSVAYGQGQR